MIGFVAKRLSSIVPTLLLVVTVAFFLLRAAPGGPFDTDRSLPAEVEKQVAAYYHLNEPLSKQYADWLGRVVLHGDLGPTFRYPNRTVNEILAASLPVSAKLGFFALLLALAVGLPLGIAGAVRRGTWIDTASMAAALVGLSIPRFVLAPFLVLVFSLNLYLLPAARWETWRHMILPVACAGLPMAAYIARLARSGMLEVIGSDFVRTARAKGVPEHRIIVRHALRGALLPVVSYLGPAVSGLLVGSLVIERIFDIPGMGRYFVEAALNRDYNLVMGVTLVYGALLMTMNALVDVAYALLDPRVELR